MLASELPPDLHHTSSQIEQCEAAAHVKPPSLRPLDGSLSSRDVVFPLSVRTPTHLPSTSAIPAATYRISHGICRSHGAAGIPFAWIVGEMLIERAALRNHGGYIVPRTPLLRVSPIHGRRKGALLSHYGAYVAANMMAGVFTHTLTRKGRRRGKKKKTF